MTLISHQMGLTALNRIKRAAKRRKIPVPNLFQLDNLEERGRFNRNKPNNNNKLKRRQFTIGQHPKFSVNKLSASKKRTGFKRFFNSAL